jgi:hypothetical protein
MHCNEPFEKFCDLFYTDSKLSCKDIEYLSQSLNYEKQNRIQNSKEIGVVIRSV